MQFSVFTVLPCFKMSDLSLATENVIEAYADGRESFRFEGDCRQHYLW